MTSQERHEARYQRRKAKREAKRKAISEQCGNYDQVFSYNNLYMAGKKCMKNVMWKTSSQNYMMNKVSNTYNMYKVLKQREFKFTKPYIFKLNERGKIRTIQAQKINERIMQRTLCDNVLVPIYDRYLIYDSAANRVKKGIDHTVKRIVCQMQRHYRRYGLEGWIVTCDFRDFFNSAGHKVIYEENKKRIYDKDIRKIANQCMEVYGKVGFGLGAHTSQIYTSIVVSPLDHYIKDQLRVKSYGRYVDDFYFFAKTKEEAKEILDKVRKKITELGLELNEKKTRLQKFSNGFKFLKTKFFCTTTGKIVRKTNRKSAIRMKRKLRKFKNWIQEGRLSREQVVNAYYSWRGCMKRGNNYIILKRMDNFFKNLMLSEI